MPVIAPSSPTQRGYLTRSGGGTIVNPDPTPVTAWAATTVRNAWGLWTGGNAQQAEWNSYHSDILGHSTSLRFRLTFMASAQDATWAPKVTAFDTLTDTTSTSSMFNAARSPNATCVCTIALCLSGQSLQTAAETTANKTFWEGIASRLVLKGFDSRFADGRPKIIFRLGHECNQTWYPWGYGNDIAKANFFRQAYNQARSWIDAKVTALGGDTTAYEYAFNITCRRGQSVVIGGVTYKGRDFIEAALPNVEIIEGDAYDYSGFYNGKTASSAVAQREQVWWERSGKSTAGAYTDLGQGLDLVFELAGTHDMMVGLAEVGNAYTVGAVNNATGGFDNPDWWDNITTKFQEAVDDGRGGYLIHFNDDTDDGLNHRVNVGSAYDYDQVRDKIAALT